MLHSFQSNQAIKRQPCVRADCDSQQPLFASKEEKEETHEKDVIPNYD